MIFKQLLQTSDPKSFQCVDTESICAAFIQERDQTLFFFVRVCLNVVFHMLE